MLSEPFSTCTVQQGALVYPQDLSRDFSGDFGWAQFWLGPPDFRHGDNRKWVHNIFTSSQENGPSHWYLIMYFVSVAAKKSSLTVSVVKPSFASTVGSSSSQDNQGEDVLSLTVPSKLVHV